MNVELMYDELPVEIQERMLLEQEKQENERNPDVFRKNIGANAEHEGFDWNKTEDGFDFWLNIFAKGNFAAFYERYPKASDKLYSEEEVRYLFIKHCKDLYTQHSKFSKLLLEQDLKWFEENKK